MPTCHETTDPAIGKNLSKTSKSHVYSMDPLNSFTQKTQTPRSSPRLSDIKNYSKVHYDYDEQTLGVKFIVSTKYLLRIPNHISNTSQVKPTNNLLTMNYGK